MTENELEAFVEKNERELCRKILDEAENGVGPEMISSTLLGAAILAGFKDGVAIMASLMREKGWVKP